MENLFASQKVSTPYGVGIISEVRSGDVVVVPSDWQMAGGQKPTFYLNSKDVKPFYDINSSIQCSFGKGKVVSIRATDGIYIIQLDNWQLADGKSPTLFLNEASISTVKIEIQAKTETKSTYTADCLLKCLNAKNAAADFFKKNELFNARSKYLEAVEVLQYLGDNLTNEEKAKVFEQSVICNNNISLCCLRLKNFLESVQFGKNALMLIETLESRIPGALVWQCLVATAGMTMEKFLKDWKKKSLFLIGKAELGLNNYQSALDSLKAALSLIAGDELMVKQIDELKALIATAQAKRTAEKKKEKATWSKAFEKGKKEENSLYSDPIVSPFNSSAAASPKKNFEEAAEEDDIHIDLSKYGMKDIGTKKKPAQKPAAATSAAVAKPVDFTSNGFLYVSLGMFATLLGFGGLYAFLYRKRF